MQISSSLELRLVRFVFSKEDEEEDDEESVKSCLPVFRTLCDIFMPFFACSYFLTCSPP